MTQQDVRDIIAAGPDLAEFVSDYCSTFDASGADLPPHHELLREVADAYTEQAVSIRCPQDVVEQVRDAVIGQIDYYLP